MRNLKRLLTMTLAIAFMMSLMVVGAGATAFKDDKDITHKDAVEKMASLNIINGRDNGNFDPTGIVTRAEMCKMICIAMNGGNDPKLSSSSVATSSFTDTKGHWAEGYIEYCVNMGIVAGLGDKTFGPDLKVTPSQASKMLLVALGYDAAFEKFTGATWALNSNKVAMQKGLYDEIQGIDPNAPMTRDAAAQMIHNFCDAPMVKYEFGITGTGSSVSGVKQAVDINLSTGTANPVYQTVLNKYYKLITIKGTITKMEYDKTKKEYGYKLEDQSTSPVTQKGTFYSKTDYSALFGMKVELLYKDKNKNDVYDRNDDTIYNITAKDSKLVAEGYTGDFGGQSTFTQNKELKFNGTYYDIETNSATVPVFAFVAGGNAINNFDGSVAKLKVAGQAGSKVRLLDVDGNGKIDKIVVIPFNVQKVTYVGSDNATVTGTIGNNKLADITTYTGMAKDDRVVTTESQYSITGMPTFVKATIANGKITATKGIPVTDYKIGDSWYCKVSGDTISVNDTIDYVAFGGDIFYSKVTDPGATSKEVAVVVKVGTTNGSGAEAAKPEALLMFTDGTKKTVIISKINGFDAVLGSDRTKNGTLSKTNYDLDERVGELVTYTKDSDNYYELTDIAAPGTTPSTVNSSTSTVSFAGFDGTGSKAVYSNKAVGGYTLADDAVVFVVKKTANGVTGTTNDVKTYTGKELKNSYESLTWPTVNTNGWNTVGASALYKEVNGFNYAKVAVINAQDFPSVNSSSNYGYLVGDVEKVYVNSKNYLGFPIWNGKDSKTVYAETTDANLTALTKGTVIGYDNDGTVAINTGATSTLVKNVMVPVLVTDAITGWDDSKTTGDIAFATNNATSKVDSDTVVIFVDSKNKAAPKDGATYTISKASDTDGINGITAADANSRYLVSGSSLKLLVVDISDKIKAAPVADNITVAGDSVNTQAQLTAAFALANTVTVSSDTYAPTESITVPANKTLIVKNFTVPATGATVTGTGILTVSGNVTGSAGTLGGTGTVNVIGNISMAAGNITVNTFSGDIAANGAGILTINGTAANVTASKFDAQTGAKIALGNGAVLTIKGAATNTQLEALVAANGAKLILDTNSGNGTTAKWYDKNGKASSTVAANDGTASTELYSSATIALGTFVKGDAFSATNKTTADLTNKWVRQ